MHAEPGFPLGDDLGDAVSQLSPVPSVEQGLAGVATGGGAHAHLHPGIVAQTNTDRASRFNHIQAITPSLEVVTLTGYEVAPGLAVLLLELGAFAPNPSQARNNRQTYRVVVEA